MTRRAAEDRRGTAGGEGRCPGGRWRERAGRGRRRPQLGRRVAVGSLWHAIALDIYPGACIPRQRVHHGDATLPRFAFLSVHHPRLGRVHHRRRRRPHLDERRPRWWGRCAPLPESLVCRAPSPISSPPAKLVPDPTRRYADCTMATVSKIRASTPHRSPPVSALASFHRTQSRVQAIPELRCASQRSRRPREIDAFDAFDDGRRNADDGRKCRDYNRH